MSTGLAIAYGALGGLIAWVAVFALPELRTLKADFKDPAVANPAPREYVVSGLIAAALVILGCVGPLVFGDPAGPREAVAYGVAAEALFGNVAKGVVGT